MCHHRGLGEGVNRGPVSASPCDTHHRCQALSHSRQHSQASNLGSRGTFDRTREGERVRHPDASCVLVKLFSSSVCGVCSRWTVTVLRSIFSLVLPCSLLSWLPRTPNSELPSLPRPPCRHLPPLMPSPGNLSPTQTHRRVSLSKIGPTIKGWTQYTNGLECELNEAGDCKGALDDDPPARSTMPPLSGVAV